MGGRQTQRINSFLFGTASACVRKQWLLRNAKKGVT
jgi:hypothetical protein